VNSIRIKWPTGIVESRADYYGKAKADHANKRAASLRAQAAQVEGSSPTLVNKARNSILRDADAYSQQAADHLANHMLANQQARAMKALVA
jgi:hypothetical protein